MIALLLLGGCTALDLSPEWELDRLRVLAIRAEPAEPRPGDAVTFTRLLHVPGGAAWNATWFACVSGSELGCSFDASLLDGVEDIANMTPQEQAELFAALQAAGLIGVEPETTTLSWLVPDDALAGLTADESLEGLAATVQMTLATEDDTELVIRRLAVSLATTPNTNPDIGVFEVDEVPLAQGAALIVDADQTYDLRAELAGGLEKYSYQTTDGAVEEREEEPEWRWYTDRGTLGEELEVDLSEDPSPEDSIQWTSPEEPGAAVIHAVVLDGRGGMGWWTVSVQVR